MFAADIARTYVCACVYFAVFDLGDRNKIIKNSKLAEDDSYVCYSSCPNERSSTMACDVLERIVPYKPEPGQGKSCTQTFS